jgi:hypothetical protein
MKSIGPAFDDFDLVVDSFQPPCVDGIATVIDNAIGISNESSRETDEWFDPALEGNHAPAYKCFICPTSILVAPESLQVILQDVGGAHTICVIHMFYV